MGRWDSRESDFERYSRLYRELQDYLYLSFIFILPSLFIIHNLAIDLSPLFVLILPLVYVRKRLESLTHF